MDERDESSCRKLLRRIEQYELAWPFREPVDPIAMGCPDYLAIIANPMDLRTVGERLDAHRYQSIDQFASEMRLIFDNCIQYNRDEASKRFRDIAHTMRDRFEREWTRFLEVREKRIRNAGARRGRGGRGGGRGGRVAGEARSGAPSRAGSPTSTTGAAPGALSVLPTADRLFAPSVPASATASPMAGPDPSRAPSRAISPILPATHGAGALPAAVAAAAADAAAASRRTAKRPPASRPRRRDARRDARREARAAAAAAINDPASTVVESMWEKESIVARANRIKRQRLRKEVWEPDTVAQTWQWPVVPTPLSIVADFTEAIM